MLENSLSLIGSLEVQKDCGALSGIEVDRGPWFSWPMVPFTLAMWTGTLDPVQNKAIISNFDLAG